MNRRMIIIYVPTYLTGFSLRCRL